MSISNHVIIIALLLDDAMINAMIPANHVMTCSHAFF